MRKWLALTVLILIALIATILAVISKNAESVDQRKASQVFNMTATAVTTLYYDCMGTKTGYECELYRDQLLGTKTVNPTVVLAITTLFAPRTYPPTNTPTEIPTSAAPSEAPTLTSPLNGTILHTHFPELKSVSPARAWATHYVIYTEDGTFRLEYAIGDGGPLWGRLSDNYQVVTPTPIPDGHYLWFAYACRPTAAGGCGPKSETRSFVIQTP